MIIVEYTGYSKGRTRTHEAQVDEAETMTLNGGALVLSTRGGTVVRIFAEGAWKNAALLQEVVVRNPLGQTMIEIRDQRQPVSAASDHRMEDAA